MSTNHANNAQNLVAGNVDDKTALAAGIAAARASKISDPELDRLLAGEDTVDVTDAVKQAEADAAEIAALANEVAKDEAETAAEDTEIADADPVIAAKLKELEQFQLSSDAKQVLDWAMDNVASNDGRGIEDPSVRLEIVSRAAYVNANGTSFGDAVTFIAENIEDAEERTSEIYKLCFAAQKAANFVINLKYRRALDPREDMDLTPFIDPREEQREPPYGLGPEQHSEFDVAPEDELLHAFEELHLYLQIVSECYGWSAVNFSGGENSMPYLFLQEKDESFTRITDAEMALDIMEVRRKQSRAKRAEKNAERASRLAKLATKAMTQAGARRAA